MTVPIELNVPTPVVNITLPENVPLMCDARGVEKIFGISRTTLWELAKMHPDFPVRSIGRCVRYMVPDLYAWFRDYPERTIQVK